MTWGFTAVAAATVGSSLLQSRAVGQAADSQAAGNQAALNETGRQYDLTRSDYAPYRAAGVDALGKLQSELYKPITSADVMSDPGYQFGMQQGQQALDRKAAAGGGRVSGASLKAASQYATDYASTGYGAAYQRGQDRLNRLQALAGIGQTATNGSAIAGGAASGATAGLLANQGSNAAGSTLAQGNIWGNAVNQLGAAAGRWAGSPGYSPSYQAGGGFGSIGNNGVGGNNPSAYTPG